MHLKAAGRFKDVCLKILDEVAATRTPVVITPSSAGPGPSPAAKRGQPVAQLVPYVAPDPVQSLAGSILRETGDPYCTGEQWDAERDAGGS